MVELLVGGKVYSGWKDIRISHSMESATGAFALSVSDRRPWEILPDKRAVIRDQGEVFATGWIDKAGSALNATSHDRKVAGRGLASDLVDCSAMNEVVEWNGLNLSEVAAELAAPFGVKVIQGADVGDAFDSFKLQPGESAWEALERACRMRGLLAHSDLFGDLWLAQPGAARSSVSLVEGKNILEVNEEVDRAGLFSEYIVRGQSGGSDAWNGDLAAQPEGRAFDPSVLRYRPLLILAEASITPSVAQARAEWEAAVRAARASKLSVKVQGWRQSPGGKPWEVNMTTPCVIPSKNVDAVLLVTSLDFSMGSSGKFTKLVLKRPDAFLPKPQVPQTNPIGQWSS